MLKHFSLLLRFLVAGIFILSGFEKLISPSDNFLYVMQAYRVMPYGLEKLVSVVFPWLELGLGVFLALGLWLRPVLLALAGVSVSFMAIVGQAIIRDLPIDNCGCFGNLVHLPLRGVIFLDLAIVASVILCLRHMPYVRRFSLDAFYDARGV